MLSAARKAGIPIPVGEVAGEAPDFWFATDAGPLGIEMSEILRPASSGKGIVPLEQEAFHKEIMEAAQLAYYENSQARPVKVQVYFTDARGAKQDKHAMAQALADLAVRNAHRANPFVSLKREWDELKPKWDELPDGFSSVTINSLLAEDWWSGEVGGHDVLIDTQPTDRTNPFQGKTGINLSGKLGRECTRLAIALQRRHGRTEHDDSGLRTRMEIPVLL
jgi:hypothetical protein